MIHIVLVMEIVAIIIAVMVVIVIYYNSKCGEEPGTSLGCFLLLRVFIAGKSPS